MRKRNKKGGRREKRKGSELARDRQVGEVPEKGMTLVVSVRKKRRE